MATAHNEGGTVEDLKMYRPPQNEEPNVQFEEIINRLRTSFNAPALGGGGTLLIVVGVFFLCLFIWAATGFYTVSPAEQAALRTFGEFQRFESSGLHWHYPAPIGVRNVVSVTNTRQLNLGFRSEKDGTGAARSVHEESLMITGDENIVDVRVVVQYRIGSLRDFLFSVDDPGDSDRGIPVGQPDGTTLRDIAETAVRQVVGARNIDDVLTTEKDRVQTDILLKMILLANSYNTGIEIQNVLLQDVNPPTQVQAAFEDVVRAREDRETTINKAQAYEAAEIPRAEGAAAQIVEAAQGFRDGRIAKAQGEADGFLAILDGYHQSPDVTRRRLYLEAMEEILPGVTKFILSSENGVLPFLPIDGSGTNLTPAAATGGGS
jgi:membrane protease subunit HflK